MKQKDWINKLNSVLNKFNIKYPKNYSLYIEAFTHVSYANDQNLNYNYERLEFLGDSAIQWVIVNYLYGLKPKLDEGTMSITKGHLVKRDTLINESKKIGLDELIFVGNSIDKNNIPQSLLEDVFESFIGAVAQDQGIKKVSNILNQTIINEFTHNKIDTQKDEKTRLQEIVQASSECKLKYEHVKVNKKWKTNLYLVMDNEETLLSCAIASNTSESDKLAASIAIEKNIFFNKASNINKIKNKD